MATSSVLLRILEDMLTKIKALFEEQFKTRAEVNGFFVLWRIFIFNTCFESREKIDKEWEDTKVDYYIRVST